MTRILIDGIHGQVGHELKKHISGGDDVICVDRHQFDLSQPDQVLAVLNAVKPDIIINPAAYTAVDKAESEPDVAESINARAPGILAEWTKKQGALLVHYSTDYVFDGQKDAPYVESDSTHPLSVYGASKLRGEEAIRACEARHLILRTTWVLGAHGNNFLKTILRLAAERESLNIVADQWGAPTTAALIASATKHLVDHISAQKGDIDYGTYHLTAGGSTNWCEYARYVVELARKAGRPLKLGAEQIHPITTDQYPLPAKRPLNSRLDTHKFKKAFGLALPDWQSGVKSVFNTLYELETAVS